MIGSQINRLVLQALENGDKYGLEIIKEIEEFTNGQVVLKQPSLYSALQRLEKRGVINSFWQDSDIGGRRHYYSLTNFGKNELMKVKKAESSFEYENQTSINKLAEQQNNIEFISQNQEPEKNTEIKQISTKTFEQYNPKSENTDRFGKSFSQKMREYSEPDASIFDSPTPPNLKTENIQEKDTNSLKENLYATDESSITHSKEPLKSSKNDINYKDILGDLDADLPESNEIKPKQNIFEQQPTKSDTYIEKPKRVQSEYSKQIEKILKSNTNSNSEHKNTYTPNTKQNRDLVAEINKRYNLNNEYKKFSNEQKTSKIATNTIGYTHINQDNITVKPYSKTTNKTCNTKNFLNINKFNLCRASFLTIIFLIELIVSYFCLKEQGKIYQPHAFLYIFYGVLSFAYFGIMMLFTLKDLDKKIRLKDINWWANLFFRFILTVVLITFVLSICLCVGMQSPLDIEFFTLWYIPLLAIANILVSWIIGVILYSTKVFRV